jgi:ketosteroid isomerase-like protein
METKMIDAHSNAQAMRAFFEAFGSADRAALERLISPGFVWRFPGKSPISGEFRGIDGLLNGIRATAMTLGDGQHGFELLHVFADDDTAVTVHRDFFTGEGDKFDLRYFLFVRFENGRMAEVNEVPFDQAESDRYWQARAAAVALKYAPKQSG